MIRKNFKLLIKSLYISIPLFLLLLYTVYVIVSRVIFSFPLNNDVLMGLKATTKSCLLNFIVFFYCGYEFSRMLKKTNIDEALFSHENGRLKTFINIFSVLFSAVLLIFLLYLSVNIYMILSKGNIKFDYFIHVISVLFLYIVLGCTIPLLLGIILAQKLKRRISAYGIFAVILFAVSPISDFIPGGLSQSTGINFWQYKRFFSYIFPSDTTWIPNWDYGINAEIYRWNLNLFWAFLFIFLFVLICIKGYKKIRTAVLCLLAVLIAVNGYGYLLGGNFLEKGPELDSISMEHYMYYKDPSHKQYLTVADFQVISYQIDLNIWRQLEAKVSMKLSENDLDKYNFTLYHGYNIKKITDLEGNNLNYQRNSDYFTVTGNGNLSGINIEYSGGSVVFYSNSQASSLPGFFPYYPMAGYHIFKLENPNDGFTPVTDISKADFVININSPKTIYSNLPRTEENSNSFSGNTEYPMLFSGFYTDASSSGYTIYDMYIKNYGFTPCTPEQLDTLQEYIDRIDENQENRINLKDYTVIGLSSALSVYANIPYGAFLGSDVIILDAPTNEYSFEYAAKSLVYQKNLGFNECIEKINQEIDELANGETDIQVY